MCNEVIPNEFWKTLGQYVYGYMENGEYVYIGKGNGDRAKQHIKTKSYDLDNLYIIARNLERFNSSEKTDSESFLLESYLISRKNPRDNLVSGHYKECFEVAKFSELFNEYRASQNDNFEALPDWYISNYDKIKGRLNVMEIKSDIINFAGTTQNQLQVFFSVYPSGEVKSLKFAVQAKGERLDQRVEQLYTFLESCDIERDDVELTNDRTDGNRYTIKKFLTIEELISIFDDFYG